MRNIHSRNIPALPLKALVVALAAAFAAPAWAEANEEVERLVKPESSISLGVGHIDGDNQRFGVHNGLGKGGDYFLGNFSLVRRADDTGTWLRAEGRNLGLETREIRLEHERQGNWRYYLDVGQSQRNTPYEIHSRLLGVGTDNQSHVIYNSNVPAQRQTPATSTLSTFKLERVTSKLGLSKLFFDDLMEFKVDFQNEDKKGNRLFGRGHSPAQEFLAEPIDFTTRQLDMVLNYTGERLQLSGGYYGSWFLNSHTQLNVAGGDDALRLGAGPNNLPFSVIALPPDNQAHQLHLTGGYQISNRTNVNFKLSRSRATQTDSFASVPSPTSGALPANGLNRSGRNDLGGRLDTTLAQVGITSRPLAGLSLLGNVRYEDRDDKTTVAKYIDVSGTTTTDGFNEPRSLKMLTGKLEAAYLLPQGFRVIGGLETEQKERSVAGVRIVGYRAKTQEDSYRLEVQRTFADSVSGSLAYVRSNRTGTDYRTLMRWDANANTFSTTPYINLIQPIYLADRDRDRLRLLIDWAPLEALSLQFAVESSKDEYGKGRGSPDVGPRQGEARLYSVDAAYALNSRWRLTAWASRSTTEMDQTTGSSPANYWDAALRNSVTAYGVGLRGQVSAALAVGTDLVLSRDSISYKLGGAAPASLPKIDNDLTTFKAFGKYALNKDTSIRLEYVFDRRKTNDWTWNGTAASGPYVYTDGTWLYQRPEDKVHFVGASVSYSFR